jgi:non-heme chloroperoxidase
MPVMTVDTENSGPVNLAYEDYGSGTPVILIHGYPLSGRAWDKQVPVLLAAGHRVITYDRRGSGRSSQPASGYNWDTFAADLAALIDALALDHVILVGHSMGTGEVTRYLSSYGSSKVDRAVLISPIPPYLSQAPDNPEGIAASMFDGFRQSAAADGPAWLKAFLDLFYNIDQLRGKRVSDEAYNASFNVAVGMSAISAVASITTWQADFRADLPKINVPVLVIQGDADQVLPFDKTGKRLPGLISDVDLTVVAGGPHAIPWTHADQVNQALLGFLGHPAA